MMRTYVFFFKLEFLLRHEVQSCMLFSLVFFPSYIISKVSFSPLTHTCSFLCIFLLSSYSIHQHLVVSPLWYLSFVDFKLTHYCSVSDKNGVGRKFFQRLVSKKLRKGEGVTQLHLIHVAFTLQWQHKKDEEIERKETAREGGRWIRSIKSAREKRKEDEVMNF